MSVSITQQIVFPVYVGSRFLGSFSRADLVELHCAITVVLSTEQRCYDYQRIIAEVCAQLNVTQKQLMGPSRVDHVVFARHLSMKLIREKCGFSTGETSSLFGGRDHGAALHATRRIAERRLDKNDATVIKAIEAAIDAQCAQSATALPSGDSATDAERSSLDGDARTGAAVAAPASGVSVVEDARKTL